MERRFRRLFDSCDIMLYECDLRSGRFTRSGAIVAATGFEPKDLPAYLSWWTGQIHEEDRAAFESAIAQIVTGDANALSSEYRLRHQDGSWHTLWDRAIAERDEKGHAVRLLGLLWDVSRLKAAEHGARERLGREMETRSREQTVTSRLMRLQRIAAAFEPVASREQLCEVCFQILSSTLEVSWVELAVRCEDGLHVVRRPSTAEPAESSATSPAAQAANALPMTSSAAAPRIISGVLCYPLDYRGRCQGALGLSGVAPALAQQQHEQISAIVQHCAVAVARIAGIEIERSRRSEAEERSAAKDALLRRAVGTLRLCNLRFYRLAEASFAQAGRETVDAMIRNAGAQLQVVVGVHDAAVALTSGDARTIAESQEQLRKAITAAQKAESSRQLPLGLRPASREAEKISHRALAAQMRTPRNIEQTRLVH